MDYRVPTKFKAIFALTAIGFTCVGYLLGNLDFGFLIGISIATIALAAYVRRDLTDNIYYWILLMAWTLIHVAAIILINQRISFHPAILIAPIFIVDYILVLGSLFLLPTYKD
ncbi:hypothetical protein EAH87_02900 [Sphingomonas koreensis]|nr:hypothetical protein EAH87_02900 [Sphingomonas koreensis]